MTTMTDMSTAPRGRFLVEPGGSTDPSATPGPMTWIPGGAYLKGCDDEYPEEAPAHEVTVDGFWLDITPVTNRQYAAFVTATRYRTAAERGPDPRRYPGVASELLVPGSAVFRIPHGPVDLHTPTWWEYIPGA